jgi:uncharacterized protein YecA (UPF0149 family)
MKYFQSGVLEFMKRDWENWQQRTAERALQAERASRAPKMAKIGRNDPCPCGSGKKYKKCCLQ